MCIFFRGFLPGKEKTGILNARVKLLRERERERERESNKILRINKLRGTKNPNSFMPPASVRLLLPGFHS
jgi:hypothetical protein